jgi:ABC-type transport system involved in multi-copper enzyme maturation permease subunit
LIARNTLREAARQRLFQFLVLLALALVLGARWLRDFNFGAPELKFLADCGFGAMAFLGSALTITATAQLFFSEIENRTALTLLSKPVWRAEFILGKLLGVAALAAVFCALLTGLLSLVLAWREAELAALTTDAVVPGGGVSHAMVALGGLMQWLRLLVLAAFTLLVASFAQSQLFSVVTGFLVLVVCHLQHLAQESYVRAGSAAGMFMSALISAVLPNFQVFLLVDSLAAADLPAAGEVIRVVLYGTGYAAAGALLAILSFRRREI